MKINIDKWSILLVLLFGLLLVGGRITMAIRENQRLGQLCSARTLAELRQRFPHEIQREVPYALAGETLVCVYLKPTINLFSTPSGPPVLIFGDNAVLDFCADIGDSPSFAEKWGLPH